MLLHGDRLQQPLYNVHTSMLKYKCIIILHSNNPEPSWINALYSDGFKYIVNPPVTI